MVGGYGVCYVFHKNCLTCLRLCDDECALTFTDRREQVYNSCAEVCRSSVTAKSELLVREKRSEVFESYSVADLRRIAAVYLVYACKREILFSVVWRTHMTLYDVAGLQSVALYLLHRNVNIVWRRKIIVVA